MESPKAVVGKLCELFKIKTKPPACWSILFHLQKGRWWALGSTHHDPTFQKGQDLGHTALEPQLDQRQEVLSQRIYLQAKEATPSPF